MKRFALVMIFLASTAQADRWQAADRMRVAPLADPQISPDGTSVAVLVTHANTKDNRWDSDLVVVDVASGSQRMLTIDRRGLANPRWSPNGAQIAFLANVDQKRQIFLASMSGGDARRITDAPRGVQQFTWSPDGSQIAYVTADEPVPNEDKNNRSFELGDDDYLSTTAPTPSHVWIVDAATGKSRRVTSGAWSLPIAHPPGPAPSPLSWSPDGKSIAITRRASAHAGTPGVSRVAIVDVATGNVKRLTSREADETQPVFSPDGASIAYWHSQGSKQGAQNAIWIAPAAGGEGREVTSSIDRHLFRSVWMPDGKSFLTGAHDGATTSYWLVSTDGAAKKLDLGGIEPYIGFWIDASVAKNGAIAFTGLTPTHPRELYVMSSATSAPRQLTHFNDFVDKLELGRSESITWKNEGFDENGVLTFPPGFDASKKYPLVLYIHGGPRSASTTGFSILPQLFAAQGWVVLQPNYRGSDNLGNRYTTAIQDDAGAGPGRDVIAAIDTVKKRGFVDESKILVGGWSYGGYMTSWMIGHYPIFRAAVSGAAVNNLVDSYVLADSGLGRRQSWGSPYTGENMKRYIEQSPITYAPKIRTPTLIMSDTGDVRVPVVQSFEMFHALLDNGVETKFIAYPVSGHSPDDPIHITDIDRRYVEWFATHLK